MLSTAHTTKKQKGEVVPMENEQSSWVPTNPLYDPSKPMQVGGQAVLEGVMMRAPGMVATAVRRTNGEIVVKKEPHISIAERHSVFKFPILRGAVGLVEMLIIGMRTLNFSAEVA